MKLFRKNNEKQAEIQNQQSQRGAREARAPLGRRRRRRLVVFIISVCFSLFFLSNFLDLGWAWQDFLLISHDFGLIFALFCPGFREKA